jgi:hypothetical protein
MEPRIEYERLYVDGSGHRSRVIGDVAAVMAAVQW